MPEQDENYEPAGNTNYIVSGWGTTSSGGEISDILQWVEVPYVSDESMAKDYFAIISCYIKSFASLIECTDAYGSDMDPKSMVCAGREGKDSCQVQHTSNNFHEM